MPRDARATRWTPSVPDPFTRRATAAIGRLIEHAPATGGLALRIAQADLPPGRVEASGGRSAAPVSTDGDTLNYTAACDALPVDRQAGWVAHVVLHAALRHPQRLQSLRERLGDVDAELFEVCADAIVDGSLADLGWLAPREAAVPIEQLMATVLGRHVTRQEALRDWDLERLYREIDDRRTAGLRQAATTACKEVVSPCSPPAIRPTSSGFSAASPNTPSMPGSAWSIRR